MITCGIDWAEDHHDVALVDESGKLLAKRRIGDDVNGYRQLVQLLADFGDRAEEPVPVAVETARGLLIACLRTTGRKVYSINPMAVARYRERRTVARAKSDHADAMTLANILRTDAAAHRRSWRRCCGASCSPTPAHMRAFAAHRWSALSWPVCPGFCDSRR